MSNMLSHQCKPMLLRSCGNAAVFLSNAMLAADDTLVFCQRILTQNSSQIVYFGLAKVKVKTNEKKQLENVVTVVYEGQGRA